MKNTKFEVIKLENKYDTHEKRILAKLRYSSSYVRCFLYTPNGNFLVLGFAKEIKEYLNTIPKYFCNKVYKGRYGIIVNFWKFSHGYLHEPHQMTLGRDHLGLASKRGYTKESKKFTFVTDDGKKLSFKKLPNKWIDELDDLIKQMCAMPLFAVFNGTNPSPLFTSRNYLACENFIRGQGYDFHKNIYISRIR